MDKFTNREKDICNFLIKGWSNGEIANKLFISSHTVKAYVSTIIEKLEVKNRTEAAYILGKNGII